MIARVCKPSRGVCKSSRRFCKTRAKPSARIRSNRQTVADTANTRYRDKDPSRSYYAYQRRTRLKDPRRVGVVLQDRTVLADADLQESGRVNLQEHAIPVSVNSGGGR